MTVSRVINGEQTVRPLTRAAVEDAIRALNYAPNSAARSLAGGGQVRIGLLYSNPSAAYLSEFLVGVLDQADRKSTRLNSSTNARLVCRLMFATKTSTINIQLQTKI